MSLRNEIEASMATLVASSAFLSQLRLATKGTPLVIYGGFLRDLAVAKNLGWMPEDTWAAVLQLRETRGIFTDMDIHVGGNISADTLRHFGTMISEPRTDVHQHMISYVMAEQLPNGSSERKPGQFCFEINIMNSMYRIDHTVNALCYRCDTGRLFSKGDYSPTYADLPVELLIDHCISGILMPFGLFYEHAILKKGRGDTPLQFYPSTQKILHRGYKVDFDAAAKLDASREIMTTSFLLSSAMLYLDDLAINCSKR